MPCGLKVDDLQARALGAVRTRLKDQLTAELNKIDDIVETLSTGKSATAATAKKKPRRKGGGIGRLFDKDS